MTFVCSQVSVGRRGGRKIGREEGEGGRGFLGGERVEGGEEMGDGGETVRGRGRGLSWGTGRDRKGRETEKDMGKGGRGRRWEKGGVKGTGKGTG